MKKLLLMGAMLSMMFTSFSQQGNNWYFGNGAALHFPTGGGSPTVGNGALFTNEGCAAISDASGNLLFYTNGISIWDAAHTVINSGTPLLGDPSATQSAVIVPRPGTTSRYFIFTQGEQYFCNFWGGTCQGLNYSEVDVSSGVNLVSANNSLLSGTVTTEKVTATCNSNGTDYWVSTLKQNGDFVTYPVTSSGVGSAIISSGAGISAFPSSGLDDRVGYMKFSPDGKKLALARRQSNSISEIFSFNPSTGAVISNDGSYHTGTVYGLEFSADNNFLYTSENFISIYQYDLNAAGYPKSLLHSSPAGSQNRVGALQLGPDGNIYVANGYENADGAYLDVIQNINSASPSYLDNHITLQGGTASRLGLPDFVSCFFQPTFPCEADVSYGYVLNGGCSVSFSSFVTPANGTTILSYRWDFGDGTTSTEQNPTHWFEYGGTEVCLTVTAFNGKECCTIQYCDAIPELDCDPTECNAEYDISFEQDACTFNFYAIHGTTNREVLGGYWDFGDGNTTTGLNANHTYTANGSFVVSFTAILRGNDGECCTFTFTTEVTCDEAERRIKRFIQSISSKPEETSSLKIAPNPSKGIFNIDLKDESFERVVVRNIQGKVIKEIKLTNEENKLLLNLSNEANGIYLVTAIGNNSRETIKISKQ